MNIKQKIIPKGRPNRPERALASKKLTIHNTANPAKNANAEGHAKYLVSTTEKKSWHFTCDDTEIFQHLPTNEIGYHAKSGNSKSIGIEICENQGINHEDATDNAAKLSAHLLKELGLEVEDVVTHKFWTGKNCPRLLLDKRTEGAKWKAFKEKVRTYFQQEDAAIKGLLSLDSVTLSPATAADDLIDLDHETVVIA